MTALDIMTVNIASKPGKRPFGKPWQDLVDFVIKRDNYQCHNCHSQLNLEVHHRIPLKDGGNSLPSNLITLCNQCHKDIHFALAFYAKGEA
jgi:N6-L-threonylcarbamoyladenine synthase